MTNPARPRALKPAEMLERIHNDYPANGHQFSAVMKCRCGRTWYKHQQDPKPCTGAIHDLAKQVIHVEQRLTRQQKELGGKIKRLKADLEVMRGML